MKRLLYFVITALFAFMLFKLIVMRNFTNFDFAIGMACIILAAVISLKEQFNKRKNLKELFRNKFKPER